jgi:hypothetical protein
VVWWVGGGLRVVRGRVWCVAVGVGPSGGGVWGVGGVGVGEVWLGGGVGEWVG